MIWTRFASRSHLAREALPLVACVCLVVFLARAAPAAQTGKEQEKPVTQTLTLKNARATKRPRF